MTGVESTGDLGSLGNGPHETSTKEEETALLTSPPLGFGARYITLFFLQSN